MFCVTEICAQNSEVSDLGIDGVYFKAVEEQSASCVSTRNPSYNGGFLCLRIW